MKTKSILVTLGGFLAGAALCLAADSSMGTWKLNEGKSKFAPEATKNSTVVYEAAGDNTKVMVDGMTSDGKPVHSEWTGKFDGKDYPLTGDPSADMRSYNKVNDRTMDLANKKAGKVVATARIVVAADGKSRTVKVSGTDSKGAKTTSLAYYDKQ